MTQLSKLERVPLREAWKHEAQDFTPWLAQAENMKELASVLSLDDLEVIATEHFVGDFKLDILCADGEEQVIIENQLERTNHSHLGQILTYAAGVNAKKVIWVAESFRTEHIAALNYLNLYTTEEVGFFAVEIELWRIGASPFAPKFNVVCQPQTWAKAGREQARVASSSSPVKQLQLRFWTGLNEYLEKNKSTVRPQAPAARHWHNVSIGRSGFKLAATVNSFESRLRAELYISHSSAKHYFNQLWNQKDAIEQACGMKLDWQELPEGRHCRIAVSRAMDDLGNEAQWFDCFKWLEDHLGRLDIGFRKALKELN